MNWLRTMMLPVEGSAYARDVDNLYLFLVWLSVFFFVLIAGLTGYFVWRYRKSRSRGPTPHITHHIGLELTWSIIPLLILIGIFFWGFHDYMNASVAPEDALEIQVSGKKWLWTFEYPDGMRTINEIHVPVNRPVRLIMSSEDVIHSFFIPAFRVKNDVLPNRYSMVWFHPIKTGTFTVFCAEYCGKSHSDMMAKVHVDDEATYLKWVEEGDEIIKTTPLPELGKIVWENRGCATCHSIDGTRGQGPSFKGIWAEQHKMADGSVVKVDENYIRESLMQPQAKIRAGYEGIMPTFQGMLREREILGVIEFIKSLGSGNGTE
ncbi:MAG: cytochrome c oxidase subunit II [Bryobacteraceae bacterium]